MNGLGNQVVAALGRLSFSQERRRLVYDELQDLGQPPDGVAAADRGRLSGCSPITRWRSPLRDRNVFDSVDWQSASIPNGDIPWD